MEECSASDVLAAQQAVEPVGKDARRFEREQDMGRRETIAERFLEKEAAVKEKLEAKEARRKRRKDRRGSRREKAAKKKADRKRIKADVERARLVCTARTPSLPFVNENN